MYTWQMCESNVKRGRLGVGQVCLLSVFTDKISRFPCEMWMQPERDCTWVVVSSWVWLRWLWLWRLIVLCEKDITFPLAHLGFSAVDLRRQRSPGDSGNFLWWCERNQRSLQQKYFASRFSSHKIVKHSTCCCFDLAGDILGIRSVCLLHKRCQNVSLLI